MKNIRIKNSRLLWGLLISLLFACNEKYDFETLSGVIEYDPAIDAPLIRSSLTARDFFAEDDSLIRNYGDTVILVLHEDSLFYFDLSEFSGIPPQDTAQYILESEYTFPILPFDSLVIDSMETYVFSFENNMRLDSLFTNDGFIMIEVFSTFKHTGILNITSPNVLIEGQQFQKEIQISSAMGDFYFKNLYPLTNTKILIDNSVPGEGSVRNYFHLVLYRNPGQGVQAGDKVMINFSYVELDQFESIFGFAGNDSYAIDTVILTGLEDLGGVTGTFSVTDPRIRINYSNSFGLPIGIDLAILGYFGEGHTALIDPPPQQIHASDNYLLPDISGSLVYNKQNIPNIEDLLTFPPADSLLFSGEATANEGVSDASNFVLKNSRVNVGLEVEIPLAFKADLQLRDTFKLDMEDNKAGDYVEYANLHYRIRNEFPVTLDPYLILYDSIAGERIDTIFFTESDDPFIPAAPVDSKGISMVSQVEETTGIIRLDKTLIDHFFNRANKMIIVGRFSSYQSENVIILNTYKFDFRCNLEAKIHYQTDFNDSESNDE
jgi:hypothetical protein